MARWSKKIENSISIASREVHNQDFLEAFFDSEVYIPHNEKEEEEFGDFSLVISSMALLIYVATAGKEISETVKKRIISDLIYQLEQRPYEFVKLTKFGQQENEIVTNVFERMKDDYENKKTNLDNIIRIIDMVYKNNTAKRLYLLRLCFYCAYADNHLGADEHERILEVAKKLGIYKSEIKRIHQEVVNELGI
jgi:uncharacterized tellurite resistance protein B-like protein